MDRWDAVVDVSNVCWDPQLAPVGRRSPVWGRLELVTTAWRQAHGSDARIALVADNSLAYVLDDARELKRLRAAGGITTRPVADEEILNLARDHKRHILTRDHYVDHRRDHPWIADAAGRFHRWQFDGETVTIVPLGIKQLTLQDVSAAIEGKQLKRHRLDPYNRRHRAVLQTRWQCQNTLCPESAHWQGQLLVWPLVTDYGQARCPTCDEALTELGPRERLHEIVVEERSGAEIMRFPLEAGSPVIVGRGLTIKGVNLSAYGVTASAREAVEAVSRRHLTLQVEEPAPGRRRMVVTDLDSRNGTVVERPPGAGQPTVARPGQGLHVMAKDLIVLGDAVTLRLSGKQYMAIGRPPAVASPTGDDSLETTAYRGPDLRAKPAT